MRYFVIAYPALTKADFDWLQSVRVQHDPQHRLIAPHVTLVYGVDESAGVSQTALLDHVRAIAADTAPIHAVWRIALPMPDPGQSGAHLFIVPDEGFSALVRLHDRLYTGPLAAQLRLDIGFVPHITVAAAPTRPPIFHLAQRMNATPFALPGDIDRLMLVGLDMAGVVVGTLTPLAEVPLTG